MYTLCSAEYNFFFLNPFSLCLCVCHYRDHLHISMNTLWILYTHTPTHSFPLRRISRLVVERTHHQAALVSLHHFPFRPLAFFHPRTLAHPLSPSNTLTPLRREKTETRWAKERSNFGLPIVSFTSFSSNNLEWFVLADTGLFALLLLVLLEL